MHDCEIPIGLNSATCRLGRLPTRTEQIDQWIRIYAQSKISSEIKKRVTLVDLMSELRKRAEKFLADQNQENSE
jgi:hypothetical protein